MKQRLNFSPHPFRLRTSRLMLLWALNALAVAALVYCLFYWQRVKARNTLTHVELRSLQEQQGDVATRYEEVLESIESIDIKTYRKNIEQFHRIQQAVQTHWGSLLDDLAVVLNEDVRIVSIAPQSQRSIGGSGGAPLIRLAGEARNKQAQLKFIETLQKAAQFENVVFESERYNEGGIAIQFEIQFHYLGGGGPS